MPRLVWITFILLIMMLPVLRRFVFHRTAYEPSTGEAARRSALGAGFDVAFSAAIPAYARLGPGRRPA